MAGLDLDIFAQIGMRAVSMELARLRLERWVKDEAADGRVAKEEDTFLFKAYEAAKASFNDILHNNVRLSDPGKYQYKGPIKGMGSA